MRCAIQAHLTATRDRLIDALRAARLVGHLGADIPVDATADLLLVLMEGLQVLRRVDRADDLGPAVERAIDRLL